MYINFLSQIFALVVVFGFTYFIFRAFGLRRDKLQFSSQEKREFDVFVSGTFGRFATIANIFGTLTSLATVYVFFIGTSKVFGIFVFATIASLLLGVRVTNFFTKKLMEIPRVWHLYRDSNQISAVVPSLSWAEDSKHRLNSMLVKYISILNLAAVIWLEFTVFSDISALILDAPILANVSAFIIVSFLVIYFVIRFGLRGFVFADLVQSPLIAAGSVIVLVGIAYSVLSTSEVTLSKITIPLVPTIDVIFFILHVFVINSFLVLVTEGHWMRVWLFGDRETVLLLPAISSTVAAWFIIILIGLIGGVITTQVGNLAVAEILNFVQTQAPFVVVAFWIAAVAALISTADANIFGLLLVLAFDSRTGTLVQLPLPSRHVAVAAATSCIMGFLYFLQKHFDVPLEKLIFILIPLCLNIIPTILCAALQRRIEPMFTLLSLGGYTLLSIIGLLQEQQTLAITLSAALFPLIVGIIALVTLPKDQQNFRERTDEVPHS